MRKQNWLWIGALAALAMGCNGDGPEPGDDVSEYDSVTLRPDTFIDDPATGERINLAENDMFRFAIFDNWNPDIPWQHAVESELPRAQFEQFKDRLGALDGSPGAAYVEWIERGDHGMVQRLAVPKALDVYKHEQHEGPGEGKSEPGAETGQARQGQFLGDTAGSFLVYSDYTLQPYCLTHQYTCIQPDDHLHSWCWGGLFEGGPGAGINPESQSTTSAGMPDGFNEGIDQVVEDLSFTHYTLLNQNRFNNNLPSIPPRAVFSGCGGWLPISGSTGTGGRNIDHQPYGTATNREGQSPRTNDVLLTKANNVTFNNFGRQNAGAATLVYGREGGHRTFNTGPYFGTIKWNTANFSIMFNPGRIAETETRIGATTAAKKRQLWKHIVAHEFGHTLGLNHNLSQGSRPESVMGPGGQQVQGMADIMPLPILVGNGYSDEERDRLHDDALKVYSTFPVCPDPKCGTKWMPFGNTEK